MSLLVGPDHARVAEIGADGRTYVLLVIAVFILAALAWFLGRKR